MSSIIFHQKNGPDVKISGRERAHMVLLTTAVANAVTGRDRQWPSENDPKPYTTHPPQNLWLEVLDHNMKLGSDALSLATRIHATCEIHGWVDGPNRRWLAELIGKARAADIFRAEMGWEALQMMLAQDSTSPVVMSFSVTDQFPNAHVAKYKSLDPDEWYNLSSALRWELAEAQLRKESAETQWGLELRPQYWEDFRFHDE